MPILNYTSQIAADKSIMEIQKMLSMRGATKIIIDYEGSDPVSLTFALSIDGRLIPFSLPANIQGVYQSLHSQKINKRFKTIEHARKVAWRIMKDWTAAQMAIIDAHMATLDQVFLPYAITPGGQTFYNHIKSNSYKLLK